MLLEVKKVLDLLEELIGDQLRKLVQKDNILLEKLGSLLPSKDTEEINNFIRKELVIRTREVNLELWMIKQDSCDLIYETKKPSIKIDSTFT